jgi:hypothetical protein
MENALAFWGPVTKSVAMHYTGKASQGQTL